MKNIGRDKMKQIIQHIDNIMDKMSWDLFLNQVAINSFL